ncbi:MAG TPA: response regulator transcription factor [Candidatus Eisenbacteria bacterium]|uniref:Response regulator transcription factor n=1 Tax=Eiseniibacteriota bacterium TaxID=2212470 RepID=A0A7V2AUM4_UNCEI|nr:response regulator transcription factor [Candidatus Eisenbacteria bacterium]
MSKIRILLIEDNLLLREGITSMLNDQKDFEVVASAEDGNVFNLLKKMSSPPDIVLLDLGLEKEDSLNLMNQLLDNAPGAKIIAMDIFPEQHDIVAFVKAGGSGFILKNAPLSDYIKTIRDVAGGLKVIPPALANSLFAQLVETVLKNGSAFPKNSIQLTSREQEVVAMISEGLGNKEIAGRLHIATYTVKSHVHNILEKLALNTRLQIAAYVHRERPE